MGDYDPHLHRELVGGTTNLETLGHLLKGALGTGILAMPQAFNSAGWLCGLVAVIVVGGLCTLGMHVLVNAQYTLCKRNEIPLLTYPASMKMAFESGPACLKVLSGCIGHIVNGFLISYQIGVTTVYLIFVAQNIQQIVEARSGITLNVQLWCVIVVPLFVCIMLVRNLKKLAPFSACANVVTVFGIAGTMYYLAQDVPSLDERNKFAPLRDFALFFGTVLFALEAVGVIITVENHMLTPKGFGGACGVLNISMATVSILYAVFGCLGYLKYGTAAKGSITLNLPNDELVAQMVKGLFTFAVYISFSLQGYPAIHIITTDYLNKRFESENHLKVEMVVRMLVVLVSFLLGIAVPKIGLIISLVGSFCLPTLGFLFPAMLDFTVHYPDMGVCCFRAWQDLLLTFIGIIGFIIGTTVAVSDIIKSFE